MKSLGVDARDLKDIRVRHYAFQVGLLHYSVSFRLRGLDGKNVGYVTFNLNSVDSHIVDPNLDYDNLKGNILGYGFGYGVSINSSYVFKTLANLAAILKEVAQEESLDEFRCTFIGKRHLSFWKEFIYYIAKPTSAVRDIISSELTLGIESWVVSLNKCA